MEPEVEQVFNEIRKGNNFILEGGAGSGKTHSLISIIKRITLDNPHANIVCITYTNSAVSLIKSRISNPNLSVSTIHEFMWSVIKKFQKEIKKCLITLMNDETQNLFLKPKGFEVSEEITLDYFDECRVEYDEYYTMEKGLENIVSISHDQLLILAERMFAEHNKLSDIVKDLADFIFIDEYQDTSEYVISILLTHLAKSKKTNIVGFFGDSMQSIYDTGVGDLEGYSLTKIIKTQNRRNSTNVIDLANKIRTDGLQQVPSHDIDAPNMVEGKAVSGMVKFIFGSSLDQLELLKKSSLYNSLGFNDVKRTKELRLTHKLNASEAGFSSLFELYNYDLIVNLISKIEENIKQNKIFAEGKTFDELVIEANIRKSQNGPILRDLILADSDYKVLYDKIKSLSLEEVTDKCKIKKESLLSYKFNSNDNVYEPGRDRDKILQQLDSINDLIELYNNRRFNEFLKVTKYKIDSSEKKKVLSENMDQILEESNTIGKVIYMAQDLNLIRSDDLFSNFIENRGFYLWQRIKDIPFYEYRNSISYLKEYVSVMTQHKVKGSEYENVLLILDNGNWRHYDFLTLFDLGSKSQKVRQRTRKLFYVSVTRAKRNLIIYLPTDKPDMNNYAKKYFNQADIIDITSQID